MGDSMIPTGHKVWHFPTDGWDVWCDHKELRWAQDHKEGPIMFSAATGHVGFGTISPSEGPRLSTATWLLL